MIQQIIISSVISAILSFGKRFTFRLPDNLFENLKNEADEQGLSLNALILQILWSWVKEKRNGKSA